MRNPARWGFRWSARQLSARGLLDERRGERIADLAWPRFLTMFARFSLRVADAAMVGIAVGPAAVAGLGFAAVYWQFALGWGLAVAGATIGTVSRLYSAGRSNRLGLAVKQSVWIGLIVVTPLAVFYATAGDALVGVLASDGATTRYGGEYLRLTAVALVFVTCNVLASRTLAGADDTRIAMSIRATGAVANVALNAAFVFGLGMGVAGAALGTVLAEALVTACFAWGFVAGRFPGIGSFPVRVTLSPPYFDAGLSRELLAVAPPLFGQQLARVVARFPLFAMLALFGPAVVAAFEVGRRVRNLLNAFGAAFGMATSSLVGQALGRDAESEAADVGRDAVRFSALVYLAAAGFVGVFAEPIAGLFAADPALVSRTVPFVRAAAVSFVGLGAFRTFGGLLKAAGDTRWITYARTAGLYVLLLPLTYVGTRTDLGTGAVYLGIVAETWLAALVVAYRVRSGRWISVSRSYRPSPAPE